MKTRKIHISIPVGLLEGVDRALLATRERLAIPRLSRSDFICMHLAGVVQGHSVAPADPYIGPQQGHTGATTRTGVVSVCCSEEKKDNSKTDAQDLRSKGDDHPRNGQIDPELKARFQKLAYPHHPHPAQMAKRLFDWVATQKWKPDRVNFCMMKTLEAPKLDSPVGYFRALLEKVSGGDVLEWEGEKRKIRERDTAPNPLAVDIGEAKRFGKKADDDIPF